jgi:hypothetical protein
MRRGQRAGKRSTVPDFGLFIAQIIANTVHQTLQMWQNGAPHEDWNLLDNLDTGVPRLP